MKKKIIKRTLIVTCLMVLSMMMAIPAFAASQAKIPVAVNTSYDKEISTITMTAITDGAPAPQGAKNGVATLKFEGSGTKNFIVKPNGSKGIFEYEIRQVTGRNSNVTYDRAVYKCKLQFVDDQVYVVIENDDMEKTTSAKFKNTTEQVNPPKPKPEEPEGHITQTGDVNNHLTLLLCIMAVSLLLVSITGVIGALDRRKRKEE